MRRREAAILIVGIAILVIVGSWNLLRSLSKSPYERAPNFSLTNLEGNDFQLSDFRGKIVVIDFMATWCLPCRVEMEELKVIWEEYKDDIVIMSIGVDPREPLEALESFASEFPYATWIWAKDTANLAQAYNVSVVPTTIIIDQKGYVRFSHQRLTSSFTYMREIDQLLGGG